MKEIERNPSLIENNREFLVETNILEHKSVSSEENKKNILKKEHIGFFFVLSCYFIRSMNSILLKYIEEKYNEIFSSVSFMLIRSIFVSIFAFLHSRYNNEKILSWSEIKFKKHFFIRTNFHYFGLLFFVMALWYIRVSTVNIIDTLGPIISTYLSVLFLKEKFYPRYGVGIIICIIGAIIIINNEAKVSAEVKKDDSSNINEKSSTRLIIGCSCILFSTIVCCFIDLANKVLAVNKIPVTTQLMYLGGFNILYSGLYCLFTGGFSWNCGYLLYTFIQGFLHYFGNVCLNSGMELIDLTKIAPVAYTKIVFVLIFGNLFLGEAVYFSDVIGAGLIISYTLYNFKYPIIKGK